MSNKTKALIIFVGTVALVSIAEALMPFGPFIAIGCAVTYILGRWAIKNDV